MCPLALTSFYLLYFAPGKSLIFLDEPIRILEKGRSVEKEFEESMANRAAKGEALPEEARLLYSSEEITVRLNRRNCVALSLLEQKAPEWEQTGRYQIDARSINPYNSSFPTLVKDLKRWKGKIFHYPHVRVRNPGQTAGCGSSG